MICTSCHKAEAVIFIKLIVNNQVTQKAICASCAQESPAGSAADAFSQLLSQFALPKPRTHAPRCPACKMVWAEFKETGRFGCPACYDHFAPMVKSLIPRVHGGAYQHRGKAPKNA